MHILWNEDVTVMPKYTISAASSITSETVNRFYPETVCEVKSFTGNYKIQISDELPDGQPDYDGFLSQFNANRFFITEEKGDYFDARERGLMLFGSNMLVKNLGTNPLPSECIRILTLNEEQKGVKREYKALIRCAEVDGNDYVLDAVALTRGYAEAMSRCLRVMQALRINPNHWKMTPVEKQSAKRKYRPVRIPEFIKKYLPEGMSIPKDISELLEKGPGYLPSLVDLFDPVFLTDNQIQNLVDKRVQYLSTTECQKGLFERSWQNLFYLFPTDETDGMLFDCCIREMVAGIEHKCIAYGFAVLDQEKIKWQIQQQGQVMRTYKISPYDLMPGMYGRKGFDRGSNNADYILTHKNRAAIGPGTIYDRATDPYSYNEIGDKIKYIRLRTGMNMDEFAAYLGVKRSEYSQFEHNWYKGNPAVMRRLIEEFNANPKWVFDADRSREGWKLIYKFGDTEAGRDPSDRIPRFVETKEIEQWIADGRPDYGYFEKPPILPEEDHI